VNIQDYKAPFLQYDKIRLIAEDFLGKYNAEDVIPVPIEHIIEYDIGLNIIPIPGLQHISNVDGFISTDFTSISVDQSTMENFENRYRFTLAHEVGHWVIHKDGLFEYASEIEFIKDWKKYIIDFDEKQYSLLEYQAYCFAGLILVPAHHLKEKFDKALDKVRLYDIEIDENSIAMEYISRYLQDAFNVSDAVISKRIKYDKLIKG